MKELKPTSKKIYMIVHPGVHSETSLDPILVYPGYKWLNKINTSDQVFWCMRKSKRSSKKENLWLTFLRYGKKLKNPTIWELKCEESELRTQHFGLNTRGKNKNLCMLFHRESEIMMQKGIRNYSDCCLELQILLHPRERTNRIALLNLWIFKKLEVQEN